MNKTDKEFHRIIHNEMMKVSPDKIFTSRVEIFDVFEQEIGMNITGNIIDVGCRSGYAGIGLAKNKEHVREIIALESSESAVSELLPRNIRYHEVDDIVKPILGSFDDIPFKNYFDFVVAFGAIQLYMFI